MAGKLSNRKSRCVFTTEATVQGRALIVEAKPFYLTIKQARYRKAYDISYETIYRIAVTLEIDRRRAEKKAAKKLKRKAGR